jgi:cyclomaltodextrinase
MAVVSETIWWHVYPLGFLGSEKLALPLGATPQSRLRNLEPWLKYLVELGCNGLLLAPIFASGSHGYDTIDHFAIDSRLGTNDDFLWLVDACRSMGVKVCLDGVFNHVGRNFGPFLDVKAHRQSSRYASWFHIDWHNCHNEDGFSYKNFEGHSSLVTLNHSNHEVSQYVVDVMLHWLRAGISGWRLDAAYAVPRAFWQTVIPRVQQEFPDTWFLAEVIHGDYGEFVRESGVTSVTQYELWKAIYSSLNDKNFFELQHAIKRNEPHLAVFAPNTFLGNHDVSRIATQLKNPRHLDLAICILFTLPGVPSIYAGDEQGFRAVKENRPGGDDAIRPTFPASADGLPEDGWRVFSRYQELARFRRSNSWLAQAKNRVLHTANTFFVYELSGDNRKMVVALNCSDQNQFVNDEFISGAHPVAGQQSVEPQSYAIWTW